MRTDEVVDTSGAPIGLGRGRAWLRVGVPVGGVALVIVAILAIALYSDRANRAGALALSQDLLDDLQSRVLVEVSANLLPAIRATRLVRDIVQRNTISDRERALESFAWSALRQTPQVDALYSGDSEGNFIMVQRDEGQAIRTKLIRNMPGPRIVEWIRHDAEGRVTRREQDPGDTYDPRIRDWYQGALKADDVYWSSAYIFYSHREPGVTAAIRYRSEDGADHVFGVDITLKALSDFLGSLKIGHSGRAVIIDDTGHLIAAPPDLALMREQSGEFVPTRLDELGASVMSAAYDRFRVEGYGRRLIEIGGVPTIVIASRLPLTGRDWTLLMAVPEADFTGFVANNGRKTLWLSLVVIALATGLAVLLVIQGLRADRSARLLLDRSGAIERQSQAFANLARQADLFDRSREAPLQALTAALGDLAAARRTSVWRLSEGGRQLHCEDAYERDAGGHVAGVRLSRAELPQFFKVLEAGDEIRVPDAGKDRRTVDFHRALMHPIDSRDLDVVPVRGSNNVVGAILLEDAAQMSGAREFAALFANVLAARMGDGMVCATPTPEKANATPPSAGERSFDTDLAVQGLDNLAPGAELFPSAAVMSIKFSDTAALAAHAPGGATTLADRIAVALQEIAAAHHIPYVKLVGYDIVAAAGLVAEDTASLLRIADAAIEARERCLELFEAGGHEPSFRIGIGCGLAIGGHVGQEPRLFNLWGHAVHIAELLAETGSGPGTIQVSEVAHAKLRAHFLFRPRGSFYLPRLGARQTFVLGSRQ